MHTQPTKRSTLFLMELILSIFIFSLTSTVCIRIFVKSHTLEQESINRNHAVTVSTSIAEIFHSQEQPFSLLSKLYPDGSFHANTYTIYYDNHWSLCTQSDCIYKVQLTITRANSFLIGNISVCNSTEPFYTLKIKKYAGEETDEHEI